MKIGDDVLTKHGEQGRIDEEFDSSEVNSYDWWVRLEFLDNGKRKSMRIPFREKELKNFTQEG